MMQVVEPWINNFFFVWIDVNVSYNIFVYQTQYFYKHL